VQQLPLLLLCIGAIAVAAGAVRLVVMWRKRVKRRAYFRNRDARVRQQWADMESLGEKPPR
jgi:FtsZ-interacting cell division protein ZipA